MPHQKRYIFKPLTAGQRKNWIDPNYRKSPFYGYVGNADAVQRLGRLVFNAMDNEDHCCKANIAVIGPASTGKTFITRKFAKALGIPFIEFDAGSIKALDDILDKIDEVLEGLGIDLYDFNEGKGNEKYILPPVVIFIDEAHNLLPEIEQALLKATELNDRYMTTETGCEVDCRNVTWVIGTTEIGKLFGPFVTRFKKIRLDLYTKQEITQMIAVKFPAWDAETCKAAAFFAGIVPREVEDFCKEVNDSIGYFTDTVGDDISSSGEELNIQARKVIPFVANAMGIDEFGMTRQRVSVLTVLGRGPVGATKLIHMISPRCEIEELQRDIMPTLLTPTEKGLLPCVMTTSKGYIITPEGLKALQIRKIPNAGIKAIPVKERDALARVS